MQTLPLHICLCVGLSHEVIFLHAFERIIIAAGGRCCWRASSGLNLLLSSSAYPQEEFVMLLLFERAGDLDVQVQHKV